MCPLFGVELPRRPPPAIYKLEINLNNTQSWKEERFDIDNITCLEDSKIEEAKSIKATTTNSSQRTQHGGCLKMIYARACKNAVRRNRSRRRFTWWTTATKNGYIVENSGSIARDVLAAERTFLAWSRTGLGFVGAGSALFAAYHRREVEDQENNSYQRSGDRRIDYYKEEESSFSKAAHIASALLVANGSFLLLFATRRYVRTIELLNKHQFPIDIRGTLLAVCVTASSTVASLGLVVDEEYQRNTNDRRKILVNTTEGHSKSSS